MELLINQSAGIGDIIFCQKIENHFRQNYDTVWPIAPSISWIRDYVKNPAFARQLTSLDHGKFRLLDLTNSHILGGSVLTSKYRYANLDWTDWKNYVTIIRDRKKENLLYDLVTKNIPEYVLINNFVGTPPNHVEYDIKINSKLPIVYLKLIPGYTVFDWAKVIENASEIYTVDTSINYIIEFLQLKAKKLACYSRFRPSNFSHIKGLWDTPWEYREWENI